MYAQTPALKPFVKFAKPLLGSWAKSLVPLKLSAELNGVGFGPGSLFRELGPRSKTTPLVVSFIPQ